MEYIRKVWTYFKSEKILIICLTGFASFGLICWFFIAPAKDFGLNFFTEIMGAIITVFILDRIIKKREAQKNIPLKLAIYEDIRLYATRYIGFWAQTYMISVPEKAPENIKDFFSPNGMNKILSYLYMESEPNVTPPQKWWDWIVHNAKEFKDNGDKILDRYSGHLDPDTFGYLHQLTESSFNNCHLMIPVIRQTDTFYKTPRVKVLGSYSIEPQMDDYNAIIGLETWCQKSYLELVKHKSTLLKVGNYSDYVKETDKRLPPKCMIPDSVLKSQLFEISQFRQLHK
jgi:hypothetical protein